MNETKEETSLGAAFLGLYGGIICAHKAGYDHRDLLYLLECAIERGEIEGPRLADATR